MECREVLELRELHLDGDLEPTQELALEAHLSSCGACRAELEASEAVGRRLRESGASIEDPSFSADMLERIRREYRDRMQRPKTGSRVWTLLVTAAAAAVLAIVVWPGATRTEADLVVRSLTGSAKAAGRALEAGARVEFGETLEVAFGAVLGYSASGGASFRVEPLSRAGARLVPESSSRLRLESGRVSVAAVSSRDVEIDSPLGSARLEPGTLARLEKRPDEGLSIVVHEGRAHLEQAGLSLVVAPGQRAFVEPTGPRRVEELEVAEPDPDAARIVALEARLEELRSIEEDLEQQLLGTTERLRDVLAENRELRRQLENPPVSEAQIAALMDDFQQSAEAGFLYPLIAEAVELTPRFRDLGPRGIDLLADVISSRAPSEERLLAVLILRRLETPAVIPPLQAALMIPDEAGDLVRRLAAAGLSALDAESVSSVLRNRFEAENEDIGVRINSAIGLARIGDQEAIGFLIGLYRDESQPELMREGALEALLFANRPEAAPLFRELVKDPSEEVELRAAAISFLGDVRDQASLEVVQRIADDPAADEKLRSAAQRAYNRITGTEFYR